MSDWNEALAKIAQKKFGITLAPPRESAQMNQTELHINQGNHIPPGIQARAPYNFVPLHERVVPSPEKPGKGGCAFDSYHEGKHTGYIELTIKTETPLYIRDTLTEKEMQEKEVIEKDGKKKYINPDFFFPGGKIRIPGSSLRGMARTMVEMVSFGIFGFFEKERKYHFRSFADKSLELRKKYKEKLLCGSTSTGYSQQIKAGYLIKDGTEFKLKPAQVLVGCQFFRAEEDLVIKNGVLSERMNIQHNGKYEDNRNYHFGFKKVRFTYDKPQKHTNHSRPLFYAKVNDICNENQSLPGSIEGALVYSGWMRGPRVRPRGKHLHWVIGPAANHKMDFCPGVIEDYKKDSDRHEEANLLHYFKDNPDEEVPCFYVEEGGKIKSFGHTGLFRLAYDQTLNDFLPEPMQKYKGCDIIEAIFGNENRFSGRVFFEDADLCEDQMDVLMEEDIPQILSKPKPTTFQHYLVQHQSIQPKYDDQGQLRGYWGIRDYGNDTWLRGYKLYWHKTGENWQETRISFPCDKFNELLRENTLNELCFGDALQLNGQNKEIDLKKLPDNLKPIILNAIGIYETQHTKITPVKSGKTFIGKMRFENLSDVELGALLFALKLPEGCCHKLGMGKPLGLGSVRITPKLCLSNRKTRYESLFAEWDQPVPESTSQGGDILHFKKTFAAYILKGIGEDTGHDPINTLWGVSRMQELRTMLDFKKKPKDEITRYMELGDFKERKVLPPPTDVAKEGSA